MSGLRIVTLFVSLQLLAGCAQDARGPLNQHLPQWVTLGAGVRYRAEGHGIDRNYLLERYRLDLGISFQPWLGFLGELQDSRSAFLPHPDAGVRDRADVRQAYLRFGRESGWWDLKAGRQLLKFGSERVIGASEWGNTARAFDALKLGIHHGQDRVDLFSASVVVNSTDTWDHHRDGNNLHGVYGSFGSWFPGVKVEPYLLLRTGLARGWTYGLRMAGHSGPRWSFEAEALGQRQSDWAATLHLQRHFLSPPWSPTLLGEYNFASPGLDQLYPTNHGIYGIADQVGRRNTSNYRAGLWLHPRKWLTLKGESHQFWLASSRAGLFAASGAPIVPAVPAGASSTAVGRELDLLADIRLSRHYDIGAQWGHLFPGPFLRRYSSPDGRTFYAVFLDVHL